MAEPYLGEIKLFPYPWAPRGWALCDGAILPISTNPPLFSLLGTVYGGDGVQTFALPDLRGRAAMQTSTTYEDKSGVKGGAETVTLAELNMPPHSHAIGASTDAGDLKTFDGSVLASSSSPRGTAHLYAPPESTETLNSTSLTNAGGSQPHKNMQPTLVMSFCIATQGVFPQRD